MNWVFFRLFTKVNQQKISQMALYFGRETCINTFFLWKISKCFTPLPPSLPYSNRYQTMQFTIFINLQYININSKRIRTISFHLKSFLYSCLNCSIKNVLFLHQGYFSELLNIYFWQNFQMSHIIILCIFSSSRTNTIEKSLDSYEKRICVKSLKLVISRTIDERSPKFDVPHNFGSLNQNSTWITQSTEHEGKMTCAYTIWFDFIEFNWIGLICYIRIL